MAIITEYFEGDDRRDLAIMQHDAYSDALIIVVREWHQLVVFSEVVVTGTSPTRKNPITSFDHRTLQFAHDLLAAAWRSRSYPKQHEIPIAAQPKLANDRHE